MDIDGHSSSYTAPGKVEPGGEPYERLLIRKTTAVFVVATAGAPGSAHDKLRMQALDKPYVDRIDIYSPHGSLWIHCHLVRR